MKDTRFRIYYLLTCLGVLIASFYPLSMGIRVITDIIDDGTVYKGNYPKYIIPYFPICTAIIAGVLLMPLLFKIFKRFAFAAAASAATGLFFAAELLLEKKVVVSASESLLTLEDWQMYMCYIPPYDASNIGNVSYRPLTAVEILMGDYNPAFKLHFYIISVILIITILNSLYGFGHIAKTGDRQRLCPLIIQSVCSFFVPRSLHTCLLYRLLERRQHSCLAVVSSIDDTVFCSFGRDRRCFYRVVSSRKTERRAEARPVCHGFRHDAFNVHRGNDTVKRTFVQPRNRGFVHKSAENSAVLC